MFIIKKFLRTLFTLLCFTPIFLIIVMFAFFIDWLAKKRSFVKLPIVSSKLKLKYEKAHYKSKFGEIKGYINGYIVEIKPDEGTINIDLENTFPGLELSIARPNHKAGKNIINFKISDWKFNWAYKTRRINKSFLDKLIANKQLFILLNSFYIKWIFELESLLINESFIFCKLNLMPVFPFFPYFPALKLETILKELIEIAKQCNNKK